MKKALSAALVLLMAVQWAGCANTHTLQKKFIRKKKEPAHTPKAIFIEEGPYQKPFSSDYYYKTHYVLWKSWHDEITNGLRGNRKKLVRGAEEAYSHLVEMERCLNEEMKKEFHLIVEEYVAVMNKIKNGHSALDMGSLRPELEKIRRLVAGDYYYDKIKDSLVKDKVDLGGEGSAKPEPAA